MDKVEISLMHYNHLRDRSKILDQIRDGESFRVHSGFRSDSYIHLKKDQLVEELKDANDSLNHRNNQEKDLIKRKSQRVRDLREKISILSGLSVIMGVLLVALFVYSIYPSIIGN